MYVKKVYFLQCHYYYKTFNLVVYISCMKNEVTIEVVMTIHSMLTSFWGRFRKWIINFYEALFLWCLNFAMINRIIARFYALNLEQVNFNKLLDSYRLQLTFNLNIYLTLYIGSHISLSLSFKTCLSENTLSVYFLSYRRYAIKTIKMSITLETRNELSLKCDKN